MVYYTCFRQGGVHIVHAKRKITLVIVLSEKLNDPEINLSKPTRCFIIASKLYLTN